MTRYASRRMRQSRADIDDGFDVPQPLRTIIVIEPAGDFIDTGLLDASGDTIVRIPEPIGFVIT